MSNSIVFSQTKQVQGFLEEVVPKIQHYVNYNSIPTLEQEGSKDNTSYYEGLLSSLRRLLVFCEDGLEACSLVIKSNPFRKTAAQNTLYAIYHKCIAEFFSPKSDLWYENSRSAYTGQDAITFLKEVPASLRELFKTLEGKFQAIREELEYYETDYKTQTTQTK